MNLNTLDMTCNRVRNYTNMLSSVNCQNMIGAPTCFSSTSQTCLDHVITNVECENILYGVLDDSPTKGKTDSSVRKCNVRDDKIEWRCIDDRKKEQFLRILAEKLSTIDLNEHPEFILISLTEKSQETIEICFPLKTKSNREKKRSLTPWYDSDIYTDEKKQSRLFRRFMKSQNTEDHKAYKTFRKKLSKKKYRAKRTYFYNLLNEAKIVMIEKLRGRS